MLESRLRVWYGVEKHLSAQFNMQCNFMTEGCNGGWGFFQGLWLEHYYSVEEECAPYLESTTVDGCQLYRDCDPVAKV